MNDSAWFQTSNMADSYFWEYRRILKQGRSAFITPIPVWKTNVAIKGTQSLKPAHFTLGPYI